MIPTKEQTRAEKIKVETKSQLVKQDGWKKYPYGDFATIYFFCC